MYHDQVTVDLLNPKIWEVDKFGEFEGRKFRFFCTLMIFSENREFYPSEPHDYLRLDFSALGEPSPCPPTTRPQVLQSSSWLDSKSTNAGAWLHLGPIAGDHDLYLDFYAQFSP
jgi:hypothetical protein